MRELHWNGGVKGEREEWSRDCGNGSETKCMCVCEIERERERRLSIFCSDPLHTFFSSFYRPPPSPLLRMQ